MHNDMLFLPQPRRVKWAQGGFRFDGRDLIRMDPDFAGGLRFTALRCREALQQQFGLKLEVTAGRNVPDDQVALALWVVPEAVTQPQGYRLRVTPESVIVQGHDPAGVFYGVSTLLQMVSQADGAELPCVDIEDWPDYRARGVMLDISRDKVPTMETLYALVDRLASWKINQLQLYIEHTFAYRNHPDVWAGYSPMTGEEIMALDAYCRERFIELVPNQNAFGHMRHWLRHPRYAHLAETHDEFDTPWGIRLKGPYSLAPVNPGSIELVRSLFDELLPHFTSKQVNVGCDETVDLGQGASKAACEERGTGRVYLDFVLQIYRDVAARGYTMQFWGDIIVHYPELVPELPRDVVALEWGYEADHPFDEHGRLFASAGVPFYVCPGTASWNAIAGRTDNALGNLRNAAENGLKYGAGGYLNTDWGDRGHWQYLPVSYLGFAAGAADSWCLETNKDLDIVRTVSLFAFEDPSGTMGRIAYDLGNIYQVPGVPYLHNSSILFWLLQNHDTVMERIGESSPQAFRETMARIDAILAPLAEVKMGRPDAELIKREYANAGRLLRHACRRALQLMGEGENSATLLADLEQAIEEHKALWLARNRPGGLNDSLAYFEPLLEAYRKGS